MLKLFTDHPSSVGESYLEHLLTASTFAVKLFVASCVCLVHALLPFLFVKTGSKMINDMYTCMISHRDKRPAKDGVAESVS